MGEFSGEGRRPWQELSTDELYWTAKSAAQTASRGLREQWLNMATFQIADLIERDDLGAPRLREMRSVLSLLLDLYHKYYGDRTRLSRAVELAELVARTCPEDDSNRAGYFANLAVVLRHRGEGDDLDRAIGINEDLVASLAAGNFVRFLALSNLANDLMTRFRRDANNVDLDKALEVLTTALSERPDQDAANQAGMLLNLGNLLRDRAVLTHDRAELDEAINVLAAALRRLPAGHQAEPGFLHSLGDALEQRAYRNADAARQQEREPEEPPDLQRAIALYERAIGLAPAGSDLATMNALTLAGALVGRYQRYAPDPLDLQRAIDLVEALAEQGDVDANWLLANALRERHELVQDPGDLSRGIAAFRYCCQHERLAHLVAAGTQWGQWAADRGCWAEAAEAHGYALSGMRTVYQRQGWRSQKEHWMRRERYAANRAAYAIARSGDVAAAVLALEQGRAILLSEKLLRDLADVESLTSQGQGELARRFNAARERLHVIEVLGHDNGGSAESAAAEYSSVVEEIRGLPGHESFLSLPTLEVVMAAAQSATLAYITPAFGGGVALVVSNGEFRAVWLDQLDLKSTVGRLNRYLEAYRARHDSAAARNEYWAVLDALARWCWTDIMGPLLAEIPPDLSLVLIPCGGLDIVPLHAAWALDGGAPTGRRYALDAMSIRYAPSAATIALAGNPSRRRTENSVLVAGPGLPNAGGELDAVAARLRHVHRIPNEAATVLTVKGAIAEARILHIAAHARAELGNPLDGGISLTDGPLSLRDIMAHEPGSGDLAVLSACETTMAGTDLPDEVVGLHTGFIQAGFPSVIGSLWAVSDVSTTLMMARFYRLYGEENLSASEALRQAQVWLRDATNGEKAAELPAYLESSASLSGPALRVWLAARAHIHPYHWAAFTFNGPDSSQS